MIDISVVIPLYNEEESLPELTTWIKKIMDDNSFSYEIIFIDDGSKDSSWEIIKKLHTDNSSVKGIKFLRNYGKSAGLQVGFTKAIGDVIFTMDADLQDDPSEIPELYRMIKEDHYDLVSGWKKERHDPLFSKNLPSKFYNLIARICSGIKIHDFNCGLKAYRKQVVKSIEIYGEMHRYIPIIAKWAGFTKIGEKVVHHHKRKYGKSKFGIDRFFSGPLDLLSVLFISKFKKQPMHFFGIIGSLVFIFGLLASLWLGIDKLIAIHQQIRVPLVTESPYFYMALTAMIIGTQLFMAGFISELLSRNAPERNKYLIDEETKAYDSKTTEC
ncbi:MAG: glycosyltransferase family 2 protein [Prolixibacteraceae bacterium]|nr:glycosyltransferase family 2 protein [Prolixibacteraceae bacterium]